MKTVYYLKWADLTNLSHKTTWNTKKINRLKWNDIYQFIDMKEDIFTKQLNVNFSSDIPHFWTKFLLFVTLMWCYFPGILKPDGQNWPSGVSPKTPKTIPATAMIVASPMMMPGRYRRLLELDFFWDLLADEALVELLLADILLKIFRELKILCPQLLTVKRILQFPRISNM